MVGPIPPTPIPPAPPALRMRRKPTKKHAPSLRLEQELWASGHDVVVGIDEVGRGAWAGPLTVGAAVLPQDRRVYKVRDSKMLTEIEREAMFDRVAGWCQAWAVGHASQQECDDLGMAAAQKLAAARAIDGLGVGEPDKVLVDGNWDFVGRGTTQRVIKGDATCLTIAAASILAKVTRDRIMREEAEHFPGCRVRAQQGLPVPSAQGRAAGLWAERRSTAAVGCSWTTSCGGRLEFGASTPINSTSLPTKVRDAPTFADVTRSQRLVLRAFALWTVYVWGTRIWNIIGDDTQSAAFKAVHSVLAVISVAFAVATWVIVSNVQRKARGRQPASIS